MSRALSSAAKKISTPKDSKTGVSKAPGVTGGQASSDEKTPNRARNAAPGQLIVHTVTKRSGGQRIDVVELKGTGNRAQPRTTVTPSPVALYRSEPLQIIEIVRDGINANYATDLAADMEMSQDKFFSLLGFKRATVHRKIATNGKLSTPESERIVGVTRLIGQVQQMVEQSGKPEGFDAAKWLSQWIEAPMAALGGKKPAEILDTMEGQKLVSDLLAMMQSGAYA